MKHKLLRLVFVLILVIGLAMASTPQSARAAGIIVDQSVSGPSTSLIIGTSQPNELILIAANGWPDSQAAPTVTVDGSVAGLITFAANSSFNSGGASVFRFVAPSAGTHTIVVEEGGYSNPYFLNFAVSLLGVTNAGLTFTSASFPNATTMTASIATSTSDQYVFATSTHNTGVDSPGNPTWTGSPVTPTLLETLHIGSGIDSTIAGFNAATPGIYSATVSDSLGGAGGGVIILVAVNTAIPPLTNDNFANAEPIALLPFTATVDITNATNEQPDEPQNCYSMPNTVWYAFTPTEKTLVRANTQGSAISNNLNVYHDTGSGISGLNLVPNGCTYYYGPVTFLAEAGQTYYLQAGGIYGEVGTIQVNLEQLPLPANDDFANAMIATLPLPFDDTVDTQYSTRQTGEPTPSCAYYGPGTRSVWYAFTPATSGSFSASIFGYAFTPVFAAYTGSSLGNLTQLGCQTYTGNLMTLHMNAGTTYYFQVGNLYYWEQGGSMQFHLDVAPQPVASFYTNPWDPSKYDTIQFQDNSYDPGQAGIQTYTWNFGDGSTASNYSATHKYAADGDYQVTHTVTTVDGRTASVTQTVQVRTHDVAITKITTPNSANVGQTKSITVTVRNIAYPETVQIDIYKSTPNGFVWVATVTKSVAALSGNRTTAFNFNYTFTSDDAKLGKVTFKAVATIIGARDAYPADNEAISLITKVAK